MSDIDDQKRTALDFFYIKKMEEATGKKKCAMKKKNIDMREALRFPIALSPLPSPSPPISFRPTLDPSCHSSFRLSEFLGILCIIKT